MWLIVLASFLHCASGYDVDLQKLDGLAKARVEVQQAFCTEGGGGSSIKQLFNSDWNHRAGIMNRFCYVEMDDLFFVFFKAHASECCLDEYLQEIG